MMNIIIITWLSLLTIFVLFNNTKIRKNTKKISKFALDLINDGYDIDEEKMEKKIHSHIYFDKSKLNYDKK